MTAVSGRTLRLGDEFHCTAIPCLTFAELVTMGRLYFWRNGCNAHEGGEFRPKALLEKAVSVVEHFGYLTERFVRLALLHLWRIASL
jgi:hypothetical protein